MNKAVRAIKTRSFSRLMNNPIAIDRTQRVETNRVNCFAPNYSSTPKPFRHRYCFGIFRSRSVDSFGVKSSKQKHALNSNHTWNCDLNPLGFCLRSILIYWMWSSYRQSIKIFWIAARFVGVVTWSSAAEFGSSSRPHKRFAWWPAAGTERPRCSRSSGR